MFPVAGGARLGSGRLELERVGCPPRPWPLRPRPAGRLALGGGRDRRDVTRHVGPEPATSSPVRVLRRRVLTSPAVPRGQSTVNRAGVPDHARPSCPPPRAEPRKRSARAGPRMAEPVSCAIISRRNALMGPPSPTGRSAADPERQAVGPQRAVDRDRAQRRQEEPRRPRSAPRRDRAPRPKRRRCRSGSSA